MSYTIKAVLEALPEKRTRNANGTSAVDYTDELALIAEIPTSKVLEIEFPEKSEFRKFSAKVRAAGRTVQKTIEAMWHKGSVYLSFSDGVKARKPRTKKVKVEAVAEAVTA